LDEGEYILRVTADAGAYKDGMEMPFAVVSAPHKLPLVSHQQISDNQPTLNELSRQPLPVQITLSNGDIWPIMRILHSTVDARSHRTDYMAATAYAAFFMTGSDVDYAREVRARLAQLDGIPELIYGDSDGIYTARFAAAFPEFVNRNRLIEYVNRISKDVQTSGLPPYTAYFNDSPAGLFALAALGEPVLLDVRSEIAPHLENPSDYAFGDTYNGYMRIVYLAAALVALGDDAAARDLMNLYPNRPGLEQESEERELLDTMLLYINSAIDLHAAYDYLVNKTDNRYVSDVPEKINFLKRVAFIGMTVSEVTYTLNGEAHTLRLENFECKHLHLTNEQFVALDLRQISGSTDAVIRYYSGDWQGLADHTKKIGISKQIMPASNLYNVRFEVTMPPGTPRGMYQIYDRLPSNLRYVPSPRAYNTERQLVELWFFYDPAKGQRVVLSYDAMKVFDAESVMGQAFVMSGHAQGSLWGATE
jgi:hypothetical protein